MYKILMHFDNDSQAIAFDRAFERYILDIHRTSNPQNKTIKELEQIHWVRFQSSNWDWENHCFIPDEPEPLPTQTWRMSLGREGKSKYEVFDERTRTWIEAKK